VQHLGQAVSCPVAAAVPTDVIANVKSGSLGIDVVSVTRSRGRVVRVAGEA
jgi:hypothetical protein